MPKMYEVKREPKEQKRVPLTRVLASTAFSCSLSQTFSPLCFFTAYCMFAQRLAFTRQTTRAFTRRFATAGSQTQGQKSRRRLLAFSTLAAATAGTTYYMMQDIVYIEDAKDAHSKVPILALHPQVGGKKDLPIVSHALDNSEEENTKPRLVILGSGWGAVSVLKNLDVDKYNVTVISENNYFLFTPLLPCATVGTHELR